MLPLVLGQASAVTIDELIDMSGSVAAFVTLIAGVFLAVYGCKFGVLAVQKFMSSMRKTGSA